MASPSTNEVGQSLAPSGNHSIETGIEYACWSNNTTSSFNGQVLSFEGCLGYDGLDLFRQSHVALERGSIYGLVAPNGSGKTSLARALQSLPNFPLPGQFRFEYLSADITYNTASLAVDSIDDLAAVSARDYSLIRVRDRANEMEEEIVRLEAELENTSTDNEVLEELSAKLSNLYEAKDEMEADASVRIEQYFANLRFEGYADMPFVQLSSGWKYKCQLISALITKPDCLVVDEPSFLDTQATAWFVEQIQQLTKNSSGTNNSAIVVLITHKEALLEEACDKILYINPASKTLTTYPCTFREFQAAHADRVAHAKNSKAQAETAHKDAVKSLTGLQKQLKIRERNFKERTSESADKRFIKGKNKEAKQNADHSAAAKSKQTKKKAEEVAREEELLREARVVPLE